MKTTRVPPFPGRYQGKGVDGKDCWLASEEEIAAWLKLAAPLALTETVPAPVLMRSLDRWKKSEPKAMAQQSIAAIEFAFQDAIHDISALGRLIPITSEPNAMCRGES